MSRVFAAITLCAALPIACADSPSEEISVTDGGTAGPDVTSGTGGTSVGSVDDTSAGSVDESGEESTGGFPEVDCTDACADTTTDVGIAVCYACRCKQAMDGYMPPPELLQCSQADPLPIYTADVSGAEPVLTELTTDEATCFNPGLLTESCQTGSRLGQLREGDIFVKWICRDPWGPPMNVYDDVGVIMYNLRNGASCWFDDVNVVTDDEGIPDLDLYESSEANILDFMDKFYFTDGNSCSTDCHDADPFIYTPYFEGIEWDRSHALGAFSRVSLDGTLDPVNSTHLTSPEVMPCTMCHRVGSAAGCDFLGPDALGDYKTGSHEQAVFDAMADGSPNWELAYWMPGEGGGPVIQTFADWLSVYGDAKDHYNACCQNPGVPSDTCQWEPIPAEL